MDFEKAWALGTQIDLKVSLTGDKSSDIPTDIRLGKAFSFFIVFICNYPENIVENHKTNSILW